MKNKIEPLDLITNSELTRVCVSGYFSTSEVDFVLTMKINEIISSINKEASCTPTPSISLCNKTDCFRNCSGACAGTAPAITLYSDGTFYCDEYETKSGE